VVALAACCQLPAAWWPPVAVAVAGCGCCCGSPPLGGLLRLWPYSNLWLGLPAKHSQPSTPPHQSINPTPAICTGSIVPQPNLPARIFVLRLLTADDWATEAVQESIDG
jgi:hypothetical protein